MIFTAVTHQQLPVSYVKNNYSFSKIDGYGFQRPEGFDYATYEEFMAGYISVLARRASKWNRLIGDKTRIPKSRKGNTIY